MKNPKFLNNIIVLTLILFFLISARADVYGGPAKSSSQSQSFSVPSISIGVGKAQKPEDVSLSLQILIFMTVLTLAPTILIMVTSFTRIVVVLSFTRNALATQQAPPNQVLVGLALFLTFFIMGPVFKDVNENAIKPFMNKQINLDTAVNKASIPIREFMFKQTREEDIAVFLEASKVARPKTINDIPTDILIPAFIISELRTAFQIGFLIFIPFLLIDVVVSTTLMAMGMMMLPPMMISLPLKLLLFIMVDGWNLIIRAIVLSFER